jgi:hypothetical protein
VGGAEAGEKEDFFKHLCKEQLSIPHPYLHQEEPDLCRKQVKLIDSSSRAGTLETKEVGSDMGHKKESRS